MPIGIDRLYVRPDGTPFYRLRSVGNRVRHLLDAQTGKLIREYRPEDGVVYKKMSGEKVHLVPGDEKVVAAIREAFALRYKHDWSYHRISRWLAAKGIVPKLGTLWQPCAVRSFLRNPVFLGWTYFLKQECGVYHRGTGEGPQRRGLNQGALEAAKVESVPRTKRPVSEMLRIEHKGLKDFLIDPEVRQKAEKAINDYFADYHVKKPQNKVNPNKLRPTTRYFLRGIMRGKQWPKTFVARLGGSKQYPKDV